MADQNRTPEGGPHGGGDPAPPGLASKLVEWGAPVLVAIPATIWLHFDTLARLEDGTLKLKSIGRAFYAMGGIWGLDLMYFAAVWLIAWVFLPMLWKRLPGLGAKGGKPS